MNMWCYMDVIKALKKFEEKRIPDNGRISLNYENAIHYDMYSVYIVDIAGEQYLFDRYIEGQVHARKWDSNENIFCIKSVLSPEELTLDSFSGIYYYHAHELVFNSLSDLNWYSEWKFRIKSDFENKQFSREKYLYRQRKQDITDVMNVLSVVVRIYREQQGENHFSEWVIMNDVAGKLWIYHDDKTRMQKDLRLCLDSLVQSGNLIKFDNAYKPTGKALTTLSEINRDELRYKANAVSQKRMLYATVLSALAAAGSAYAAFKGMK